MSKDLGRRKLHKVLANVLIPLARTLLRFGITYSEFAEIAKRSFVRAAEVDYGVRNRAVSTARVAVLTGLSRRDVRRVRGDLSKHAVDYVSATSLPAEVLERWYSEQNYLTSNGHPRALPRSGKHSFATLVAELSTDISPKAVERELSRAGRLRSVGKTRIAPLGREFVPADAMGRVIEGLQLGFRRLAETICYNSDSRNHETPMFERAVVLDRVSPADAKLLRDSLSGVLSEFTLTVNDQLASIVSRRRRSQSPPSDRTIGVGVFYFDSDA